MDGVGRGCGVTIRPGCAMHGAHVCMVPHRAALSEGGKASVRAPNRNMEEATKELSLRREVVQEITKSKRKLESGLKSTLH